jgi:hypothetical protein
MRKRALALVTAVMATGAFALGTMTEAGASAGAKKAKAPACAGKTKKKAIKAIKTAYDHFLNGEKYPDPTTDKAPFIQYMSEPGFSQSMLDTIVAGSETPQAKESASKTNVVVKKVTCTGKKTAEVQAELLLAGTEATGIFPNPGLAVLEGKTWKVSAETFCNLTALGTPTVLEAPSPCADVVNGDKPADIEA